MDVYWLEQAEADVPEGNDWLSASEAVRLNAMRFAKRRADWRLGRCTANRAVAAYLDVPGHPQASTARFAVQRPRRQSARRLAKRMAFSRTASLALNQSFPSGTSASACSSQYTSMNDRYRNQVTFLTP